MKAQPYGSARYLSFGDNALLVEFGDEISPKINCRVIALDDIVRKAGIRGVEELVPTYRSLLIRYNPLEASYEQLVFRIKDLEKTLELKSAQKRSREVSVPVVYGGEYGPDLRYVAEYHGLTEKQVIRLHSSREFRVYMIGFVAGFPYLGEVPSDIAAPRLATPRLRVPAGSVGIAERQTGIYPCEAPGGWRIVGRTPLRLFDPFQEPPTLLEPGDIVKFKAVSMEEFKLVEEAVVKGERKHFSGD